MTEDRIQTMVDEIERLREALEEARGIIAYQLQEYGPDGDGISLATLNRIDTALTVSHSRTGD